MRWHLLLAGMVAVSAVAAPALRFENGDSVVVLYNSNMPASKALAEYYALRRAVPASQVWGFNTSTNEEISRDEFRDSIQSPLLKNLEKSHLWQFGTVIRTDTNGNPVKIEGKLIDSSIRYAVLCYGMPLKIRHDPSIKGPREEAVRPEFRNNAAAVDSELSLLPIIKRDFPLAGPLGNPLYRVGNPALINPTNDVLMVARLDGPTAEIARGLVDKAMQAENDGLWGRAYIDLRGSTEPGLKMADDWMRLAAEACRLNGFETIVDTNPATFPMDFPMSQIGFYCGWYASLVCGPFSLPNCEFMPGAFAYHLHSFSAETVRSAKDNWVGPLLSQGATITMGSVYEPYVVGTPDVGIFAQRLIAQRFTFGEAAYASQEMLSWQTTVVGDPLYRPFAKPPQVLHRQLEQVHSKLIEWSHLRVVDLALAKRMPVPRAIDYLEEEPITKTSAILSEKLGDLCDEAGKPNSAIEAYQRAVQDHPSPIQLVRLHLVLEDALLAAGREDEAYQNYRDFVQDSPWYPNKQLIYEKLLSLATKLGRTNDVSLWQNQIEKLQSKPPPTPPSAGGNKDTPHS